MLQPNLYCHRDCLLTYDELEMLYIDASLLLGELHLL